MRRRSLAAYAFNSLFLLFRFHLVELFLRLLDKLFNRLPGREALREVEAQGLVVPRVDGEEGGGMPSPENALPRRLALCSNTRRSGPC